MKPDYLLQETPYKFRIDRSFRAGMRVDGVIYADEELVAQADRDRALEQVINVAFLPGIVRASLAMPDIHWGYGFPIGGVAATDPESGGVISPGGVGFDISCGVRLMLTSFYGSDVKKRLEALAQALAADIPKGVGSRGKIRVGRREMEELMVKGARWAVEKGYGFPEDLDFIEERGTVEGADPDLVSPRAFERGLEQPGTLGAGNHFLEIQEVDEVYRPEVAEKLGIFLGQAVIMIHSGSRGVGHQICTDFLRVMDAASRRYGYNLPDRQLACAPVNSPEGKNYYQAMACAANYALANRQCLGHLVREAMEKVFRQGAHKLGIKLLYDVSHNIAKLEKHEVGGELKMLCVHRKGATRALPPGHPDLPEACRETGQPVIIPGDMGRASYLLVGSEQGKESFYSTCHGAGRLLSRKQAKKNISGEKLRRELVEKGIMVVAGSMSLLAEEAPQAYKDVSKVVEICEGAGLSLKVARLKPMLVVKG